MENLMQRLSCMDSFFLSSTINNLECVSCRKRNRNHVNHMLKKLFCIPTMGKNTGNRNDEIKPEFLTKWNSVDVIDVTTKAIALAYSIVNNMVRYVYLFFVFENELWNCL